MEIESIIGLVFKDFKGTIGESRLGAQLSDGKQLFLQNSPSSKDVWKMKNIVGNIEQIKNDPITDAFGKNLDNWKEGIDPDNYKMGFQVHLSTVKSAVDIYWEFISGKGELPKISFFNIQELNTIAQKATNPLQIAPDIFGW